MRKLPKGFRFYPRPANGRKGKRGKVKRTRRGTNRHPK